MNRRKFLAPSGAIAALAVLVCWVHRELARRFTITLPASKRTKLVDVVQVDL